MSAVLLPNQLSNGRFQVRIAWGADLTANPSGWSWTDVTSDVLQANDGGVTISPMGRSNEASVAQPAGCSFKVKNPTGAYTPYNPASSNYPNVRLGTPVQVRVSLDGGSSWSIRFQGEASAWAPGWDAQGKFAYVTLTASGITRRLGSGSKPLRSALYRALTKGAALAGETPLAYWPLEDGRFATQGSSPISGVSPMRVVFPVSFGGVQGAPGSDVQPDYSHGIGEALRGNVPSSGLSVTYFRVQFVAKINTLANRGGGDFDFVNMVLIDTDNEDTWGINVLPVSVGGGVEWVGPDSIGAPIVDSLVAADDGQWHEFRLTATQVAGNVTATMYLDGVQVSTSTFAYTLSRVNEIIVQADTNAPQAFSGIGHIAVWDRQPTTINTPLAMNGYSGELATDRLTRLCGEEDIAIATTGTSNIPMGPQSIDTFMNLLRECEAADLGYLLDGLGPGLSYIARSSLYNETAQITINANSGQVPATPGPQPTHDDQRLVNRVTATRTNGSFEIVEDEDGPLGTNNIGVFDSQVVVNLQSDAHLTDLASWLLHLRTVEGMRYPQVPIDLTAAPELASSWVGTVPSDRIDLTNLSNRLTQHPAGTVSLLAEGWTEFLSSRRWTVQVNCSPYQPWNVDSLNGLFRLEMAGQTLASGLAAGATSLSLATASGHALFTTSAAYPADFPLDLNVGGWQVHVTAASGASSPQTLTITASPNTSTIPSTTAVTLWRPAALAL